MYIKKNTLPGVHLKLPIIIRIHYVIFTTEVVFNILKYDNSK